MKAHIREARPAIREFPGLLAIGVLFSVLGGYLDAYCFLAHGGVFANAQTGNVVLFGVFASGGHWPAALRHLPPIAAFVLGVGVAQLLGISPIKRSYRATLLCQGIQVTVLCLLGVFSTRLPDEWFVPAISFVAAMQNFSFNTVGPWTFNSAITTGNLQQLTSAVTLVAMRKEPEENRSRAIVAGAASVAFFAGAVLGGIVTHYLSSAALVPGIGIAMTGWLLTWRERWKNRLLPKNLTDQS